MIKKIFIAFSILLFAIPAYSQAPQLMLPKVELHFPYRLKTYTGITTKIDISATANVTGIYIQSYKWDLYSDSKTIKTTTGTSIQCVYTVAGKTRTTVTALLSDGSSAQISFNVEVAAGSGTQSLQYESAPPLLPVGSPLKSAHYNPSDGVVTKYAILVNGALGDQVAFSTVKYTKELDSLLVKDYGYSQANIQYLDPQLTTSANVDAVTSASALSKAFARINETIDADDILFVSFMTHGHGYQDPREFVGIYSKGGGWLNARLIKNGNEVTESNFKLRLLEVIHPRGTIQFKGLNKWQIESGTSSDKTTGEINKAWCYRVRLRSDADADALLELEVDYLKGYSGEEIPVSVYFEPGECDVNRNGVDAYEYINDGVFAIPDESDWNNTPKILVDNYAMTNHIIGFKDSDTTNERNFVLFDKKINGNKGDGKLDFAFYDGPNTDIAALPIDTMTVNGTDTDNDGFIDYTDLNGDGDHTDGWDIDESVQMVDTNVYCTDIAAMLNAMGNEKSIVWVLSCYSGGFIKHLNAPGRVICTATQDRTVGQDNVFKYYLEGFKKDKENFGIADSNKDGNVSMSEVFNYAYDKCRRENSVSQSPRYNDSGDGKMYLGPISAKPEAGCFGSAMTLSGYTGYAQASASIIDQTVSSSVGYTATDVTVQNLILKPTGAVDIHTLPSLTGKISLGTFAVEKGGRLVIDKQYCK